MSNQLASGVKRGKWTLSSFTPGSRTTQPITHAMWLCICECGTTRRVRSEALIAARSLSCGCVSRANHSRAIGEALSAVCKRRPTL